MKFTKKANNAIRRFISSSAATVQSRKRIKLALGSCPSAAEKSHGAVLAANFHERPTDVDELGRIRQMIELENVWTAKTTINLCQGDPNADPTPVDIFSLTENTHKYNKVTNKYNVKRKQPVPGNHHLRLEQSNSHISVRPIKKSIAAKTPLRHRRCHHLP